MMLQRVLEWGQPECLCRRRGRGTAKHTGCGAALGQPDHATLSGPPPSSGAIQPKLEDDGTVLCRRSARDRVFQFANASSFGRADYAGSRRAGRQRAHGECAVSYGLFGSVVASFSSSVLSCGRPNALRRAFRLLRKGARSRGALWDLGGRFSAFAARPYLGQ